MTVFRDQNTKVYININETWFVYLYSLASYNSSKKEISVCVRVYVCVRAHVCSFQESR